MHDSAPCDDSDGARLDKLRTRVRIVGVLCLATALVLLIVAPSVLAYCEGVIGVRLHLLSDDIGAIDYEAIGAAGLRDIQNARSLTAWVAGDALGAADVLSIAMPAGLGLIGVVCLVLAWQKGRPGQR